MRRGMLSMPGPSRIMWCALKINCGSWRIDERDTMDPNVGIYPLQSKQSTNIISRERMPGIIQERMDAFRTDTYFIEGSDERFSYFWAWISCQPQKVLSACLIWPSSTSAHGWPAGVGLYGRRFEACNGFAAFEMWSLDCTRRPNLASWEISIGADCRYVQSFNILNQSRLDQNICSCLA